MIPGHRVALVGVRGEVIPGDTKENQGYRRFMRRGLAAAHSEWALICSTHNLLKLYRYSPPTPA